MKKLFYFDVTLKELESLRGNKSEKVQTILDFLKVFWFEGSGGSDPEYWDRVRVGTVNVYLDDSDQVHLDFVTRFHLGNYPKIKEMLSKLSEE